MLKAWMAAVKGASIPEVKHIVCFVGERVPGWIKKDYEYEPAFVLVEYPDAVPGSLSIGHYHNRGANWACSEWIMKLDVDAIPHVRYFKELIALLDTAGPRDWFNGGMLMVPQQTTAELLSTEKMPLSEATYRKIVNNRLRLCGPANTGPVATNFICRRQAYLALGGCDERFRGYGWEDYQQIYMLEKYFRGGCRILPGAVTMDNVTRRCCREISRRRARELFERNSWLCLLHRWHPSSPDTQYKSPEIMQRNKRVLLDYISLMER